MCHQNERDLAEGIYYAETFDSTRILKVLGKEYGAASQLYSLQDQSVPECKPVQPVQINRRKNVTNLRRDNIEFSNQFDSAASFFRIDPELAGSHNEILLKNLERDYARSPAPVLGKQFRRVLLLNGVGVIINVDENVRIEKTTSAHGFRRD